MIILQQPLGLFFDWSSWSQSACDSQLLVSQPRVSLKKIYQSQMQVSVLGHNPGSLEGNVARNAPHFKDRPCAIISRDAGAFGARITA
jgi:hypothetical protein